MTDIKVANALLSLSDKTGLVELAKGLRDLGISIMSTGGTRRELAAAGVEAREVADYTGFPEMLDGRVKTLHPLVHGGLLGRRGGSKAPDDSKAMATAGIEPIDLLAVNLYPFAAAVASAPEDLAAAIEQIDIGGPAMLRSAAKNFESVAVLVDAADYAPVLEELRACKGRLSRDTRYQLAVKAFALVARYDAAIANHLAAYDLATGQRGDFPSSLTLQFQRRQTMRYGENPHQRAAFYVDGSAPALSVAGAAQLQGKPLSYNNVADADAAAACVQEFVRPACVIVKHGNPAGVAEADDLLAAYQGAYATDPVSAFGGVIAVNGSVSKPLAAAITKQQFVEVLIAPAITPDARRLFATKKNLRLLAMNNPPAITTPPSAGGLCNSRECANGTLAGGGATSAAGTSSSAEKGASALGPPTANATHWRTPPQGGSDFGSGGADFKRVPGGLLVQSWNNALFSEADCQTPTQRAPTPDEHADLLFAWKAVKHVKSNAIVYAKGGATIGIGAGQMSRVDSARIAAMKARDAGFSLAGAVMASDAFFPFRDSIDAAAAEGITAIIQPGGSMRDAEVIAAADEAGIAMLFTGMRHFRH